MSGSPPKDGIEALCKQLRFEAKYWREIRAGLTQKVKDLEHKDGSPSETLDDLMTEMLRFAKRVRQAGIESYGCDVAAELWANPPAGRARKMLEIDAQVYHAIIVVARRVGELCEQASMEGVDAKGVAEAGFAALPHVMEEEFAYMHGFAMERSECDSVREHGLLLLTAFVSSGFRQGPSEKALLDYQGVDRETALLEAVPLAWSEREPGMPITSLVNGARTQLRSIHRDGPVVETGNTTDSGKPERRRKQHLSLDDPQSEDGGITLGDRLTGNTPDSDPFSLIERKMGTARASVTQFGPFNSHLEELADAVDSGCVPLTPYLRELWGAILSDPALVDHGNARELARVVNRTVDSVYQAVPRLFALLRDYETQDHVKNPQK